MSHKMIHEDRRARADFLVHQTQILLKETRREIFEYNENGLCLVCKDCVDEAWNDALKEIQYKYGIEPIDLFMMGSMAGDESPLCP